MLKGYIRKCNVDAGCTKPIFMMLENFEFFECLQDVGIEDDRSMYLASFWWCYMLSYSITLTFYREYANDNVEKWKIWMPISMRSVLLQCMFFKYPHLTVGCTGRGWMHIAWSGINCRWLTVWKIQKRIWWWSKINFIFLTPRRSWNKNVFYDR